MNNKIKYKEAFSGVRPSEDVVERIMDMTETKKSTGFTFKKLAAAALAFALVIGGGFGINSAVNKDNDNLKVIVAYANETMSVKSATKQHLCYSLRIAPIDDKELNEKYLAMCQKEYEKINEEGMKLGAEGYSASWQGIGDYEVFSDVNKAPVAKIYTTRAGYFVADKKNYDDVKSMTVENESKYGLMQFESLLSLDMSEKIAQGEVDVDENDPYGYFRGHKFTMTGEELKRSQPAYNGEYGYEMYWDYSDELYNAVLENPEFDVTTIKDKITFTFEYLDGSVEHTSVNISFDNDGHMIVENG